MSAIHNVVHGSPSHKPLIKERVAVKRKHQEVTMRCVGPRKELSKEAMDRFIEIYVRMVKENQRKIGKKVNTK